MLLRILSVAMNTYREAVRARILHGLLALAVGTLGYSLVVGANALQNQNRVVSDLGAASISAYVRCLIGCASNMARSYVRCSDRSSYEHLHVEPEPRTRTEKREPGSVNGRSTSWR